MLSSNKKRVEQWPSLFTHNWPITGPGFRKFATLHLLRHKLVTHAAIHVTTDFNLQWNNVTRQVEGKCCPYYQTLKLCTRKKILGHKIMGEDLNHPKNFWATICMKERCFHGHSNSDCCQPNYSNYIQWRKNNFFLHIFFAAYHMMHTTIKHAKECCNLPWPITI